MRGPLSGVVLALAILLIFPISAAFAQEDALQAAVRSGDTVAIREALAAGANVNQFDEHGFTPLLNATLRKHVQAVVTLLAAGADPNLANPDGATPLMGAAINGNLEITKILLVAGADPAARNRSGVTADTKAAEYGHRELAEYLSGLTPKTLRAAEPAPRPAEPPAPVPAPAQPVSEPIAPVPAPPVSEPAPVATAPTIESFRARYVVLKGSVLRAAPDTAAPAAGSLAPGTEIWVTGKLRDRNWYRIGVGASEMFIYGSVIERLEGESIEPEAKEELPPVASSPPSPASHSNEIPGFDGRWAKPEPTGSCLSDFLKIEIDAEVLNVWRRSRDELVPIAERAPITQNSQSHLEAGTEHSNWTLDLQGDELSYSFAGWEPATYLRCR